MSVVKYVLSNFKCFTKDWLTSLRYFSENFKIFFKIAILRNTREWQLVKAFNRGYSTKRMLFKNFIISTGKLMPPTYKFIKREIRHRCFPMNFTKFSETAILKNNFGQLLLNLWYLHERTTSKRFVSRKPSCPKPLTLPRTVGSIHIFLWYFRKHQWIVAVTLPNIF